MKWASAVSQRESIVDALNDCLGQLEDFGSSVDLAMVFSTGFRQELEGMTKRLRTALRPRVLLGCSGGGVVGGGQEVEGGKALSVTLAHLPDVELTSFHLDNDILPNPDAPPDAWREAVGVPAGETPPHFLLFSDPFSFDLDALLRGLDYAYPRSLKLGGVAANARRPGGNRLLLDHHVFSRGQVGVALSGVAVEALVAQGCRPIGSSYTVTAGERNLIFSLNHKTALECLEDTLRGLPKRDRKRAEKSLLIGLQQQSGLSLASLLEGKPSHSNDFIMRNLVGADIKRGALAVATRVRPGQTVSFHLRDPQAAREDLKSVLSRAKGSAPQGALLFSCVGRGEAFYGESSYELSQLRKRFPDLAVGGFFGGGEIGPVADTTYLHSYTTCFALFRPL